MSYETLLYDVNGDGVATITFNRPDKYNAFTDQMILETTHAFKSASRDSEVRAIILTGSGKSFCAGQDLGDVEERENMTFLEHVRTRYNPMLTQIRTIEKPVIGVINGVAAGAGASVALATDLRVMSTKASFVLAAFANIGLVPDNGLTYTLPRLVGMSKALELIWLADRHNRVTAEQALELNMATAVAEPEALMDTAMELSTKLAKMPTRALGMTKRMLNMSWDSSLGEMLDMEAQLQQAASETEDAREGILAFLEKREPEFKGR